MKKLTIKMMSVLMALAMFFGAALTVHAADSFSDVPKNAWYHEAVNFVQADGLMNGTGNGKFSPNAKINRAMFVTILYRLAGSPENPKESDFSDVPENRYYTKAVDWAVEHQIVFGTSKTTFSPNRNITREEMACMIARYVEGIHAPFLDGPYAEQYFSDQDTTSPFAKEAIELMRKTGLFRGDKESRVRPHADATRAEAAMVCMRLALKLNEVPSPATLTVNGENAQTYTLSEEDTAALYVILSSCDWQEDLYAEFVPTHSLNLWCGEYRFELPEDGTGCGAINYVNGDDRAVSNDPDGVVLQQILKVFAKYIEVQ